MPDVTHRDDSDFEWIDDSDFEWVDAEEELPVSPSAAAYESKAKIKILVELTINSVLNRISDQAVSLTNFWSPEIISFGLPQRTIQTDHGGYCRMNGGNMSLSPALFESDWPPPKTCYCVVKYTTTTEAAAVTIYEGNATRRLIDDSQVRYTLKGAEYDETVAKDTTFNTDLETDIATIITGISEITGLNTTYARASSPAVSFTTSGEKLCISLASELAAFYSHMIYIDEPTAYLIDMKIDNGVSAINGWQFFPPKYWDKDPVASVKETTTDEDYIFFSNTPYGREISVSSFHTAESNITTALQDISFFENKARCTVQLPLVEDIPVPGQRLQWTDTRLKVSTDVQMNVRTYRYNLLKGYVEVEGDAVIT